MTTSSYVTGNESSGTAAAAVVEQDDIESDDLFARLLIERIVGFLQQRPLDYSITILPPPEMFSAGIVAADVADGKESFRQDNGESISSSPIGSLSSKRRSLLESSIVLMYEPDDVSKSSGHLGLEAQNLPLLARVLRKVYRRMRKKHQTEASRSPAEYEEFFHLTSCLLLIQPNHETAWADRRRCLLALQNHEIKSLNPLTFDFTRESGKEGDGQEGEKEEPSFLWSRELDYLDILVTQHSKAPSYWAHRKYALRHILQRVEASYLNHGKLDLTNKTKDIIFAREVKTCIDVAEKFPKNYYAWTHRRYLWDLFSFDTDEAMLGDDSSRDCRQQIQKENRHQQRKRLIQLLETELVIGMWQEWLQKHPADHSAVHYSCQVLDMLIHGMINLRLDDNHLEQVEQEENLQSISYSALDQVRKLMSKYSNENESLWILRRMTYKILWKHLYRFPFFVERKCADDNLSRKMRSWVSSLIRGDLKVILSSPLGINLEDHLCDKSKQEDKDAIAKSPNPPCIHAWTFLAWCIVNLDGIDDHRTRTINNDANALSNDIIFSPSVREIALGHLTSTTGDNYHNHLVYTSSLSIISKLLAEGTAKEA